MHSIKTGNENILLVETKKKKTKSQRKRTVETLQADFFNIIWEEILSSLQMFAKSLIKKKVSAIQTCKTSTVYSRVIYKRFWIVKGKDDLLELIGFKLLLFITVYVHVG